MGQERGEGGRYKEQVTNEDVLAVFKVAELPILTATEVAEELDCSRPTAYNKLENLVDADELRKKKVGARAVVYIRLPSSR